MKWRLIRDRMHDEKGATLVMVAGMLTALLAVSAFAVDLGWLYLNTARLQKAADAAALAGVVNLPSNATQADSDAQIASGANQFVIGNPAYNTFASQILPDNQYEVTLGTQVQAFFLKVIGFTTFDVHRTSTAQYVLPVPMGSPANCFGIGDASILASGSFPSGSGTSNARDLCDNYTQNFWAAISGKKTPKTQGDPYMPDVSDEYNNVDHYFYGIDVPTGSTFLDLWIYDAGFYNRNSFDIETGDNDYGGSFSAGTHTTFILKRPDTTPYDQTDNPTHCSLTVSNGASSSTYQNRWARICGQVANPPNGTWVLKVETSGALQGTNQYALLANISGISASKIPKIYAINDMSIFTNEADGNATVWLAEILPVHAGKKLKLRFFDAGETAPPGTMTVKMPNGSTAVGCSWTATNGSNGTSCAITTANGSGSLFNNHWIDLIVDIPDNYTCNPAANGNSGCYWQMNLVLQQAHDRTVWEAQVIGNPVKLVPNAP